MKNILIVDDSATSRMLFKIYLPQDEEFNYQEAVDEESALKLINKVVPDLIVLDYIMPDINGFDLARKILGLGVKPALVLLTANVQQNILDEADELGFLAVLEKPIDTHKISGILKKLG